MAVSKIWAVKYSLKTVLDYATNPEKTAKMKYSVEEYQALKDVLDYAKDEEKTEKEYYVSGINCYADTARSQFVDVKEHYEKTDEIQAYHGYLSFSPNEVTPELAHEIGLEFARRAWGERFQVVVTTHLNTKCLHDHFVINSVSFADGLRLKDKEKAWFYLRHIADEVCREYDLSVIKNPDRNRPPNSVIMQDRIVTRDTPTRYNLVRAAIDEAIESSCTMQEFQYNLKKMGYRYKISDNLKYWTVIPKGYEKPIRLYRLGDDYTNTRIVERIADNNNPVRLYDFQSGTKNIEVVKIPVDIRKAKGSLYNLYLYYCYRLGYLPKKKIQNPNRVHYLLREDLIKLDKLSTETELLGKYRIDTDEQLFSIKNSFEMEVNVLSAKRTELRKITKRRTVDEQTVSQAKSEIAEISKRIKELKYDIDLCDDIAQRSHLIAEKMEAIEQEKQYQSKNRERRNRYE